MAFAHGNGSASTRHVTLAAVRTCAILLLEGQVVEVQVDIAQQGLALPLLARALELDSRHLVVGATSRLQAPIARPSAKHLA